MRYILLAAISVSCGTASGMLCFCRSAFANGFVSFSFFVRGVGFFPVCTCGGFVSARCRRSLLRVRSDDLKGQTRSRTRRHGDSKTTPLSHLGTLKGALRVGVDFGLVFCVVFGSSAFAVVLVLSGGCLVCPKCWFAFGVSFGLSRLALVLVACVGFTSFSFFGTACWSKQAKIWGDCVIK